MIMLPSTHCIQPSRFSVQPNHRSAMAICRSGIIAATLFSAMAGANPEGPAVVAGSATIGGSGSELTITNTPGTIINWQSFSIQPSEITRFTQNSAGSAVLNRVVGLSNSSLQGQLISNGRVFLINPKRCGHRQWGTNRYRGISSLHTGYIRCGLSRRQLPL